MNDAETTIAELKGLVHAFVDQRDWDQFHSPKNLSMSIAIEAAELMECFQWISPDESRQTADRPKQLAEASEELADVLCYALALGNQLGIDVATAVREKLLKNEQKYPAAEYRGRYGPEDPGPGDGAG